MLSSVTLDDATGTPVTFHQTSKRSLTQALGLRGIAGIRQTHRIRPEAHGGINETRWEDGRTITLQGQIVSAMGVEDALVEFAVVSAPMIQTLDNGPALLKWTEGTSGNHLQRLVKIDGDLLPPFQIGPSIFNYQATFYAEDPRAYSQTLTTATSSALSSGGGGRVFPMTFNYMYASSGGGTVTFTNNGNRATPPIFRIHGMAQNPIIVFADQQLRLSFLGTVQNGDYLEVDTAARTVKLADGSNRLNFYDPANSTWFDLPAGASHLQLLAGTFDGAAALDVIGRDAFA